MVTKIGFTGSRRGMTKIQREKLLDILGKHVPFEFHHGDCIGADAEAHVAALYFGKSKVVIHPPHNDKLRAFSATFVGDSRVSQREEKEYLERNRDIVDETDFLLAFPNGSEGAGKNRRSGTWATIRYAKRVGKPVTIVYQNGNVDKLL